MSDLRCHSDQDYETFHLVCYVLICLLQISMLENMHSDSREISRIKRAIYVALAIKLIKHLI